MGRSVGQMVDQQVMRWLQERRAQAALSAPDSSAPPHSSVRMAQRPMVTISRQYGAYGGAMGRIVARELSIDYHAQELVQRVAERADVRDQVVQSLDERSQSSLRLWVDEMFTVRRFEASDYLNALSETISALARHNSGVIVGRGGHLILDPARTLRVRAFAPLEERIQYVSEREGMSPAEARIKVNRVDQERSEFFQKHFSTNIADPLGFDLLINTSSLSLECGAQVVAENFRQRFG